MPISIVARKYLRGIVYNMGYSDESPKDRFKRPWINPAHTWATQSELEAYKREIEADREIYAEQIQIARLANREIERAFRRWEGKPRQGELRALLDRKRRRRARLDPIATVDNVATWEGAETGRGIVRTFVCPTTMYHLSVYGPVRDDRPRDVYGERIEVRR